MSEIMTHAATREALLSGQRESATDRRNQRLAVAGGILGALAASSCCILPLVLFSLGISGAWIGNLTAMAPYQPYFIGFSAAALAFGYWRVHRSRQVKCEPGQVCAKPLPNRLIMTGLILATVLVAAAASFNTIAPLIFSV
jgi:mercuric ion transport protein